SSLTSCSQGRGLSGPQEELATNPLVEDSLVRLCSPVQRQDLVDRHPKTAGGELRERGLQRSSSPGRRLDRPAVRAQLDLSAVERPEIQRRLRAGGRPEERQPAADADAE